MVTTHYCHCQQEPNYIFFFCVLFFLGKKEHANYYFCCYDTCGAKKTTKKKLVAFWETTHSFLLFYCCYMHKGAHYLLFLVVAMHVKELVKIIIFSCYHMQRKHFFFLVAMTYKGAKKPSEFNDNIWVKLKCKSNWTNIILLVHVVVISVQVGLLYEFFIAII